MRQTLFSRHPLKPKVGVWLLLCLAAIGFGVALWFSLKAAVLLAGFLIFMVIAWFSPGFLLLALVAYLPWQLALNLTGGIDLMSGRALILVLFFVWLGKVLYQKDQTAKAASKGLTARALILFFLLAAISLLPADNFWWGARKLLVFASIFPLFFLTKALVKKRRDQEILNYVLAGGVIITSVIALGQWLAQFVFGADKIMSFWAQHVVPYFSGASFGALVIGNPSWLVEIGGQATLRAVGLFPDPHMLAFYLGLASPFCLAAAFFGPKHRLLFFGVFVLALVTIFLTFSRGGYLGLVVSLLVWLWLAWPRLPFLSKKFLMSVLLVVLLGLVWVGWPVALRLASSFNLGEGSNLGRLAIWQDSWSIIKQQPIIGVGLGNYPLAVSPSQDYRSAITSHNLYLDLWAELGFFGLLAWLGLAAAAGRAAWQKINHSPGLAIAILSSLAYFSVHAFFETPIFNPTVLAFLMIILGLAAAKVKENVL